MKRILIALALLLCAVPVMAQSVKFEWDLSLDDASLGTGGGYRLYQSKTSMTYGTTPVGTVAPGINTITIPKPGLGRYYWVCTAFMADGTESDYSNEVTTVLKPEKPKNLRHTILSAMAKPFKSIYEMARGHSNLRIRDED